MAMDDESAAEQTMSIDSRSPEAEAIAPPPEPPGPGRRRRASDGLRPADRAPRTRTPARASSSTRTSRPPAAASTATSSSTTSPCHASTCGSSAETAHFYVKDAGSLNGTYVNYERVSHHKLESGDEVHIGKYRLTFYPGPS